MLREFTRLGKGAIAMISICFLLMMSAPAAWAADLTNGAQVFSANCAACHVGGGNVVNSAKTLKKDALETYAMASLNAIKTQITSGKAAMPSFKSRLTADEIEDVAAYVLDQADSGW
jgi:cytochrome c6